MIKPLHMPKPKLKSKSENEKGFSLVELVVGIVVLAIAMVMMNTLLITQSKDALEPLYRLRATQLGQSIMVNILSRAYDQNSDHNGGYFRCGEVWQNGDYWYDFTSKTWLLTTPQKIVPCTLSGNYGPDDSESNHPTFNDVDDFVENEFVSIVDYGDLLGDPYPTDYRNYQIKIDVLSNVNTMPGTTMKQINVTIKTPSNEEILFSALKGNY
jgi:MSHA pilin protein MshD